MRFVNVLFFVWTLFQSRNLQLLCVSILTLSQWEQRANRPERAAVSTLYTGLRTSRDGRLVAGPRHPVSPRRVALPAVETPQANLRGWRWWTPIPPTESSRMLRPGLCPMHFFVSKKVYYLCRISFFTFRLKCPKNTNKNVNTCIIMLFYCHYVIRCMKWSEKHNIINRNSFWCNISHNKK